MAKAPRKKGSRSTSSANSDSAANRLFEEDSTNAYNWRSKYMANVHSNNSKESLLKQKERGSPIGIFAEPPSVDSEK